MIDHYKPLIDAKAALYNLDPDLIEAICLQESSGDPLAVRAEFKFYEKYTKPMNFSDTEEVCRAMSWGLMQVMGQVARELGYKGRYLTGLLDPETGLTYGCLYLKTKVKRYSRMEDAIAAYNAGTPRMIKGGKYSNQKYVDGVLGYLTKIRQEGSDNGKID